MKKLLGFVAIFAILFAGCNKKQEEKFDSAVLIYQDGSLWTENEDGSMKWSTTLSNGTGLKVYPDSSKMAAREGKNDETEFVKVRFDNKDYWIQTALIAQNAVESVVLEDTLVYQNPDIAAVTNISVPALTIVAVSNDEVIAEDPSFKFKKISYRTDKTYRSVYVKQNVLSNDKEDVLVLRMLNKLKSTKNETVKEEVFNNALQLNCSPEVKDALRAEYKAAFPDRVLEEETVAKEVVEVAEENEETEASTEVDEETSEVEEESEETGDEE